MCIRDRVSVNADNTDEEKEQTAEERKAEENTSKINQTLKSIESCLLYTSRCV